MKLKSTSSVFRLMMLFAVILCARSASAENRLYIEPFTVNSYDVVNVPVMLDNGSFATAGFQFDMVLPEEMEFAGNPVANNARLTNVHQLVFNPANGRVLSYSTDRQVLNGTSGAILTMPLRVKPGMLTNGTVEITLDNITLTNGTGTASEKLENSETEVTLEAFRVSAYTETPVIVINPGSTQPLEFSLRNNCNVVGLQVDFTLPEGLSFEGQPVLSPRCAAGTTAQLFQSTNRVVLQNLLDENGVTGNEGLVFTLTVKAAEDFAAETAEITVNGLEVSYEAGKAVKGEGFKVQLVNGAKAKQAADDEIKSLETALATALETIATDCPDVKDSFTGEEISTSIEDLRQSVETAYTDGTLTNDYENVMQPAAGIAAAIEKLLADATAAEAAFKEEQRQTANRTAYDAATAQINVLNDQLNAAIEKIVTEYPDVDVNTDIEAAQKAIADAQAAADAAYEAVAEEGAFDYTPDTEAITKQIADLLAKAEAADEAIKAEEKRKADNKAAYEAAIAQLNTLDDQLNAVSKQIATDYPQVDVTEDINAVTTAIADARKAADAAYEAVAEEGTFTYTPDTEAITKQIDDVLAKAKAADEAIKAEEKRKADNKAAYEAAIAELDVLDTKLNTIAKEISTKYPDAVVDSDIEAARKAISDARAEADAAYEAVAEEGTFTYTPDTKGLNQLIDLVLAKAENFGNAYGTAKIEIKALEDALATALEKIATECPDVKDGFTGEKISASIAALRQSVDKANSEGTLADNYEEVMKPAADITTAIETLVADAVKAEAAFKAEAQRQADNKAAYETALDQIKALDAQLNAMIDKIAEEYPKVNVDADIKAAQKAISDAQAAANAAYEAVAEEGTFNYTPDVEGITKQIDDLLAKAKAADEVIKAEEKRQAENQAAYEAVLAEINTLENRLNEIIDEVRTKYPDAPVVLDIMAAQNAISKVRSEAAAALDAVAEEGTFSYNLDTEALAQQIEDILTKAENSGIDFITVDGIANENCTIYNLQGVVVKNPAPGSMVIIRAADGSTRKMMVK